MGITFIQQSFLIEVILTQIPGAYYREHTGAWGQFRVFSIFPAFKTPNDTLAQIK